MTDITKLVKEAREAAHYADEYAGERELWTRVADALEAQAQETEELKAALNFYSCSCDIADKRNQRCGGAHDKQFCGYVALAALKGEKG